MKFIYQLANVDRFKKLIKMRPKFSPQQIISIFVRILIAIYSHISEASSSQKKIRHNL